MWNLRISIKKTISKMNLKVSSILHYVWPIFKLPSIGRLLSFIIIIIVQLLYHKNVYLFSVFFYALRDNNDLRVFGTNLFKHEHRIASMTFIKRVICRYLFWLVSCTSYGYFFNHSPHFDSPDIHNVCLFWDRCLKTGLSFGLSSSREILRSNVYNMYKRK